MEAALLPARLPETARRHGCCIKNKPVLEPSCGYICISKSSLHLQLKSITCTYFALTVALLSVQRLLLLHITAHYGGIYSPCLWTGSISFMRVRWCDIIPPRSGLAQRHEYPLKPAYGDGWGERGRGKKVSLQSFTGCLAKHRAVRAERWALVFWMQARPCYYLPWKITSVFSPSETGEIKMPR